MYTPPQWRIAIPACSVTLASCAAGLAVAWSQGNAMAAGVCGGLIMGMTGSVAFTVWRFLPRFSAGMAAVAAGLAAALAGLGLTALAWGLATAAAAFAGWWLIYEVGVTGRANRERTEPLANLGGTGTAGRALIVYHSRHGGFQPRVQRAFAAGLQSQGWQVHLTPANSAAPTDLSGYKLLVLGVPSFNWRPARPIRDYLARVGNLRGLPVALIVSGGGMTGQALRDVRRAVERAGGRVVAATEIWTTRDNTERHGRSEPEQIMKEAGVRLRVA